MAAAWTGRRQEARAPRRARRKAPLAPARQERLRALAEAVREGTYLVDHALLAACILARPPEDEQ